MNNFAPKYIKMASQYLQESLDNLEEKAKIEKTYIHQIEKKNSSLKNLFNWLFKN